ncbi:hypothetical protein [Daejeonella lutea]|uniref:Uncharacterized protein n=1 Tax=Daejeonella lutea TaxID=572036 RepID=A0A1T5CTX0_9SPHI|nr:hypothetical protein [Daejeonella lutea]SKB62945.1 hypothetical protein SAMN05661099_1875 [Daejeonella lutea]
MKRLKLYSYVVIMTIIGITTSCTSSSTTDESKQEVTAMDSVSKDLEKTNKELEDEAKKVEESLDKIDKEFNAKK